MLLLAAGLQGCRSANPTLAVGGVPWPYGPGERPRFYMLYLPEAQLGVPLALASPSTSGWTDERMERDVARLRAAGLDGLILGMQPALFSDTFQSERLLRFLDLIESQGPAALSVVLMLVPPSPAAAAVDAEIVGRWLTAHNLRRRACLRQLEGRIMLVCPPDLTLTGLPHPALYVVRAGSAGAVRTWGDPADPACLNPPGPERQVLVHAGWRGRPASADAKDRPRWELERRGGRTLEAELKHALSAKAGLICISSWNNYVAGDFVEPNSLDNDAVLRKLTIMIRHAKEAGLQP